MSTQAVTMPRPGRSPLRAAVRKRIPAVAVGDRIGDFTVVALRGEGGFGGVYEVIDRGGRRAALKLLHRQHAADPHIRQRFEREAWLVNGLRNRHLVELYAVGETADHQPYYVMELLDGHDVDQLLKLRGRLTPAEVVDLLAPVLAALADVHDAGVIHRDIKPSNVFVTHEGRVVLLDFGIAKPLHVASLTRSQQRLGTPMYMAPEQILHRPVDARTDLYAVAAMAFQLLTGRGAFIASSVRELHQRHLLAPREAPSRYAPEIPAALDTVIMKAMAADPDLRFATARELATALRDAISSPVAGDADLSTAIYLELADAAEPLLGAFESWLGSHGFVTAFGSPNSLLVVRRTDPRDPIDIGAIARELHAQTIAQGGGAEVGVRVGEVEWSGETPVGGTLLALDWVTGVPGLHGA